jgi:diguanylate cyclase (GGDEF)-like protein/PAS domain S-box-containing protein
MTDPANSPLRAAAEAELAAMPAATPAGPVAELLHELQVHQIELEMQNETLRKTELALAESRDRYRDLYEFAPVGYLTLSAESVIEAINLTGARLLGAERNALLQHRFAACVAPEDRDVWQRRFQQIKARGEAASVELALQRGDGSVFQAQLYCLPQEVMRSGIPGGGAGGTAIRIALTDITERKRVGARLSESETKYRQLVENTHDIIYSLTPEGVFTYVSPAWTILLGHPVTDVEGHLFTEFVHPDDIPVGFAFLQRVLETGQRQDGVEYRAQHINGEWRWHTSNAAPVKNTDGLVTGYEGIARDITKRKQADEALQLAASVFSTAREGIMITDTDGTIINTNDAFTRITGFGRDEVIGKNPRFLSSGRHDHEFYEAMWRDLKEKGHWQGEIWNRRKNGEVYAEMQTITTVPDPEGNARQYVSLFSDITSLKEQQNQLEHIAHYDALTRLPNRVLLADRLHQAMAQARRRDTLLAVAFLDLDGFKAINDDHGHKAGDALLIALSARMKDSLREGDTLARIGGDEFVAVLVDLAAVEDSVPMLGRLLAAVAEPVHIGELTVQVSASLGVTFYPQTEDIEADQLQRQADQAMYQAKLAGKNRYHVFDAVQDRSVRGHHESIEHISRALVEREFTLYYQPKVNLRSGAVIGAEALIRWQHPQKGLLAPAAFLPVIEDHPLAIEIGEWVIESALSQMETWRAAGLELPVSVNVGAHQLQQPDFVQRLHALLLAHPAFRPGDLEIEVLETSALEDIARVSMVIGACRELGVAFALDDFGTGYSSLTYLKRLAVTVLKIDQSFVHDMLDDPDDLAILEGVIGLASAFRRVAIAEGVETMEHGKMLLQLGCDLAQGYGIARPMPADQMPAWAAAWITPPAWANCQQISHDNRPLLHAAVEHRAWIVAEEHYLKGERAAPPALDPHHCRFGLWLEAERRAGRGDQPGFSAIDTLHQQIHALADELCQLRTEGRAAESVARLGELYGLCNALIGQMKALEQ